jgi:hypothetical protein
LVDDIALMALQNRCSTAEAQLAAVREQAESAIEEAAELQRKYDAFATSNRTATEKAMAERDQALEESQLREDTLRAEFSAALSQKVKRILVLCSVSNETQCYQLVLCPKVTLGARMKRLCGWFCYLHFFLICLLSILATSSRTHFLKPEAL